MVQTRGIVRLDGNVKQSDYPLNVYIQLYSPADHEWHEDCMSQQYCKAFNFHWHCKISQVNIDVKQCTKKVQWTALWCIVYLCICNYKKDELKHLPYTF